MKLESVRSLKELGEVLINPKAIGPDPVYWVFSNVSATEEWANLTILQSGKIGEEFTKTFGHYHSTARDEIYRLISGEGILVLQKKHFENGVWVPEEVDEVLLVKVKAQEEVLIKPDYGHSWSNVGSTPLISYDSWVSKHTPRDYENIEKLNGMAYYLIEGGGEVKPVPNPNYKNLPEPVWLLASDLKNLI